MDQSPVFEQTYTRYLSEIGSIDYLAKAEMLGVEKQGESLVIPLYNRKYRVSAGGITAGEGEIVPPAVRVILSRYVLHCREVVDSLEDDPYKTFRDFRDSSPLISYFTANTNKTLESTFAGRLPEFAKASRKLGGIQQENASYDCSFLFHALPRIPVVINFNDTDDLFPASCSVLYRASAERFLDMECLAMTGTLLAGRLLRS